MRPPSRVGPLLAGAALALAPALAAAHVRLADQELGAAGGAGAAAGGGASVAGPAAAAPAAPAAPTPNDQPAPAAGGWRAGQRVEAYVDGAWTGATVLRAGEGAEAGRVRVSLDGYTYGVSRVEWVDAARVRRLAPTPRAAPPAAGAPAALPAGTYTCVSALSMSNMMTVGRLVVRGGDAYEWRTAGGATAGSGRYRYDAESGRLEWVGGFQGFRGVVGESSVYRDRRTGAPAVRVRYQARPGGNSFDMDCAREGT